MSKEAMKLALEALESGKNHGVAIDVLRRALAEQPARQALDKMAENARELRLDYEPVPEKFMDALKFDVAQRTWVGLTDKEKREVRNAVSYSPLAMTMGEWTEAVQDATEAKLKEKNT